MRDLVRRDPYRNLHPTRRRVLLCYEACASITRACRWAKVPRQCHYDWLETDKKYARAFEIAEKRALRTLEDEAVRRAHEGVRKTVRYKGKVVGYDTEYSDTLMVTLLKGRGPEKYRDRWTGELTGKDGGPAVVKVIYEDVPSKS